MLTSLLLATIVGLPQQLPSTLHDAVVSGRVVDADSGRPIAGAIVTPAGTAVPPPPTDLDRIVLARVLTNANGQFVIRGLRAGSLVISAAKGGYADATYGQRRPAGSTQPIPIKDDQRRTDLVVRMWKHAAISGTVLEDMGDPAVGIRVTAYRRSYVAGRRRFTEAGGGSTDDRGMYRIGGLMPGDYVVAVASTQTSLPADLDLGAPTGSPYAIAMAGQNVALKGGTLDPAPLASGGAIVYPTVFYPAAPSAAEAAAMTLKSGDDHTSVDIQVHAVRAVRVAGMLAGGPNALTSVRLVPAGADELVEPIEAATTVSDAAGAFTFPAVPPGDYVLKVARLPKPPLPSAPPDATLCAQMPISVGGRPIDDLVVPLTAGPRMSGRVEFEGGLERPSGSSLTGIRLMLDPADGSRLPDRTLTLQTGHPDESGQFTTFGVPPGRYVVNVGSVPAGWYLKSVSYQGHDIAETAVELGARDAAGVVITFTDRPSAIDGVVGGLAGPDADAVVLAYPTDQDAWSMSGSVPRRLRTARANTAGEYSLASLPSGEYYVVAVKEDAIGDWQDPALLQALARVAQHVRLSDGERKHLNLSAAEIR